MQFVLKALVSAFLLISIFHAPAWGQISSRMRTKSGDFVYVKARDSLRDTQKGILQLEGDVQIMLGQEFLSCDKATVYEKTSEVEAEGNVRISNANTYAEADRAKLNYTTNTGTMYNGYIRSGKIFFEGAEIKKLGPDIYEADQASYTTCDTCPPAWNFRGSHIRAELGGYAYIKHARMKFAFVPVPVYLPYLVVPLKSDRQSGLLMPIVSFTGSDRFIYSHSYFWAINRSQDLTATFKNYEARGPKLLGEYRYVLSPTSQGQFRFAGIRDKAFANQSKQYVASGRHHRWFLDYNHTYDLPYNFVQKAKISNASDTLYQRDFGDELPGYGDPSLENRISLSRNTESVHTSLDTSYYINTYKSNPYFDNRETIQRFPELKLATKDQHIGNTPLLWRSSINYVNFSRNDLAYDDVSSNLSLIPQQECDRRGISVNMCRAIRANCSAAEVQRINDEGDQTISVELCASKSAELSQQLPKFVVPNREGGSAGDGIGRFDPEIDIIRSGQRIDFAPEVSLPFSTGPYLDIVPSLNYRLLQYSFDVNPQQNIDFDNTPRRQYLKFQTSIRSRWSAIYGDQEEYRATRYKHEIQPEINLVSTPWFNQSASPYFVEKSKRPLFLGFQPVSDEDFIAGRGLQFDYNDRINNLYYVTMGLTNKIIKKSWSSDSATYKQIIFFRVWQTYDFEEAGKDKVEFKYPWSDLAAQLRMKFDNWESNHLLRYYPYHNATNIEESTLRYVFNEGNYLGARFSHVQPITEKISDTNFNPYSHGALGVDLGLKIPYLALVAHIDFKPLSYSPISINPENWTSEWVFRPPGNCWAVRFLYGQRYMALEDERWAWNPSYSISFDYNFGG